MNIHVFQSGICKRTDTDEMNSSLFKQPVVLYNSVDNKLQSYSCMGEDESCREPFRNSEIPKARNNGDQSKTTS
jgi:hypothetical protein